MLLRCSLCQLYTAGGNGFLYVHLHFGTRKVEGIGNLTALYKNFIVLIPIATAAGMPPSCCSLAPRGGAGNRVGIVIVRDSEI